MKDMLLRLFCLLFAAAGVFLLYISYDIIQNAQSAKNWVEVPAKLISAEQKSSKSSTSRSTSRTYSIHAAYSYNYPPNSAIAYENTQVDFTWGANNFTKERQKSQLKKMRSDNFTVFVNPHNPVQSVVDTSAPMEYLAFVSVFIVFPCFVGLLYLLSLPFLCTKQLFGETALITQLCSRFVGYAGVVIFLAVPVTTLFLFYEQLKTVPTIVMLCVCTLVVGISIFTKKINKSASFQKSIKEKIKMQNNIKPQIQTVAQPKIHNKNKFFIDPKDKKS